MSIYDWLTVAAVFVCLLISAFYSGSETALTASSRAAMLRLEKHGNVDAITVSRLLGQRERFLGAEAAVQGCTANRSGIVGDFCVRAHFRLLQVGKVDFEGRPQRLQRLDAGGLSAFKALNSANTQAA